MSGLKVIGFSLVLSFGLWSCNFNGYNTLAKRSPNFEVSEVYAIMGEEADQAMRVWKIDNTSDSLLLRKKSEDVLLYRKDKVLDQFIDRLYTTVRDSINDGVGIAAPQVGILKNIIWVQRFDKLDYPFEVYINPTITSYSEEKQPCREGCLSIPNRSDTLTVRAMEIEIHYLNRKGEEQTEKVSGFTAVIFQHEIDHLNGILYTDYLEED